MINIQYFLQLFLPDGCCHLIEATDQIESCTANLILCDIDLNSTTNGIEENNENNSIIVMIILDNIDDYIRVAKLETLPSMKSEMIGQFNLF